MLFLPKGNQQDNIEKDLDDDDDHIESGDEFDESEEIHFNVSSTLLTLKHGLKIKRRKTPRVFRYVRFNVNTDAENH